MPDPEYNGRQRLTLSGGSIVLSRLRNRCQLWCLFGALLVLCAACLSGPTPVLPPTETPLAALPTFTPAPPATLTAAASAAARRTPTALPAGRPLPTPVPPLGAPWPTHGWPVSTPEEQGIDSRALYALYVSLHDDNPGIGSVLIVRNGYLVAEGYLYPFEREDTQHLFSVTKSVVSALFGIARQEGHLTDLDRRVLDVFSEYRVANLDERKREMTIEQLLTMTGGLDWSELTGGNDRLTQMVESPDWVQTVLNLPMVDEPGAVFRYNSGGSHLLSAAIQQATGQKTAAYAQQKLFSPLGITSASWTADPQGISMGGWGLSLTGQDMARFGYLYPLTQLTHPSRIPTV